jgi:hypothetical protein
MRVTFENCNEARDTRSRVTSEAFSLVVRRLVGCGKRGQRVTGWAELQKQSQPLAGDRKRP